MFATRYAVRFGVPVLAGVMMMTGGTGQAQPAGALDKDSLVQATILADTTAVQPGTTFTVGILYKMQPEWHIYHKNPGESGFATTVKWKLPEGASVGETMYPAPLTFESPGSPDPLLSYGYDGETMLLAEVNLAQAPADGKVEINASSRWLMCSDRCIPNNKDFSLSLEIGDPQPANQELFAKYKKQVPKPTGTLPDDVKLNTTESGSTTRYEVTITAPAGKQVAVGVKGSNQGGHAPFFYPAPADGYMVSAPKVNGNTTDAGSLKVYDGPVTITWEAQPEVNSAEPLKRLDGTLVYQTVSDGKLDEPVLLEIGQNL